MVRKGFTLIAYYDGEFDVPIFEGDADDSSAVVSVIIGPNGSGKSLLLSRIADELSYIASIKSGQGNGRFRNRKMAKSCAIRYRMDGIECYIERSGPKVVTAKMGSKQCEINELPFPQKVIVVSHLPVDKFRFSKDIDGSFYKYLGLRQSTNLTTTGALESKVIQSIMRGLERPGFKDSLEHWLALAGYSPHLGIVVIPRSEEVLSDDRDKVEDEISLLQRPGVMFSETLTTSIKVAIDFLQELKSFPKIEGIYYCDLDGFSSSQLESWRIGHDAARRVRALKSTSLMFFREKMQLESYQFSDLSSGEQQIVGTNSRLLAEIADNSLVIIDEPELSLHPDWQMKYVPTLKSCLGAAHGIHVLIATHSHFMISDLDDKNSSLILSKNRNNSAEWLFELFDGDVYGRSPENILYRAFGVAASGNIYVENDLREALHIISNAEKRDLGKLREIHARLLSLRAPDNVAMNIILDRISAFITGES